MYKNQTFYYFDAVGSVTMTMQVQNQDCFQYTPSDPTFSDGCHDSAALSTGLYDTINEEVRNTVIILEVVLTFIYFFLLLNYYIYKYINPR